MKKPNDLFLLKHLQPNIIKPHGRRHTGYLLCRFKEKGLVNRGVFLGRFSDDVEKNGADKRYVISYLDQLRATAAYKASKDASISYDEEKYGSASSWGLRPVVNLSFGRGFYDRIPEGKAQELTPDDPYFWRGVKAVGNASPIYPERKYAEVYKQFGRPFDMLISVAHDDKHIVEEHIKLLLEELKVLGLVEQEASALVGRNAPNVGVVIEYGVSAKEYEAQTGGGPLGYKDGISERRSREEAGRLTLRDEWEGEDHAFGNRTIYPYGTYVFFQKIELDNEAFDTNIEALAKALDRNYLEDALNAVSKGDDDCPKQDNTAIAKALQQQFFSQRMVASTGDASESTRPLVDKANRTDDDLKSLAAALLMGRFKGGTPLMLEEHEGDFYDQIPFDYKRDPAGELCPYQAHIRKVNPREGGPENASIIRRGSYYQGEKVEKGKKARIEGLFFVSLQKSITDQLVPILKRIGLAGQRDPIAYEGSGGHFDFYVPSEYLLSSGIERRIRVGVKPIANYKGGDFFYMPSLVTLKEYIDVLEDNKGVEA